jgi:hypothetical protein
MRIRRLRLPKTGKRQHARLNLPYKAAVWIAWIDENGRRRHVSGVCLNISISGACIEAPAQVRDGQELTIGIPRIPLEATAIVRRSEVNGKICTIGLEFASRIHKKAEGR